MDFLDFLDFFGLKIYFFRAKQQQKLISEQDAKFSQRIMRVKVSQNIINAHNNTVKYLSSVLNQLGDVERKLSVIAKVAITTHQI